jgi:RNA chaperone Hfq
MAVTEEADQKTEIQEARTVAERHGPQFIPKLRGKKVIIRLTSGGQPCTGTIEGYNPYEILIQTAKGQLLVFKHAVATIEIVDEPKGYKADN